MAFEQGFNKRPSNQRTSPRRVRGGIKLKAKMWPPAGMSWIPAMWLKLFEQSTPTESYNTGIEFGQKGQTRRIEILPGRVVAGVQGPRYTPCEVTIHVPVFSHEQWDKLIEVMADEAIYAAKLLAGEMPSGIDSILEEAGLALLPSKFEDLTITHSETGHEPHSHYAMCTALLVTEMLEKDPFLAFTLRGMPGDELAERLRQRRASLGGATRSFHNYAQGVFVTDTSVGEPIEQAVDHFWDMGDGLDQLEMPMRKPEVPHPLLRRLGPSPFEARFPLVGLLATCYDVICDHALKEPEAEAQAMDENEQAAQSSGTDVSAQVNESADAPAEAPAPAAPSAADVIARQLAARKSAKPMAKKAAAKKKES